MTDQHHTPQTRPAAQPRVVRIVHAAMACYAALAGVAAGVAAVHYATTGESWIATVAALALAGLMGCWVYLALHLLRSRS